MNLERDVDQASLKVDVGEYLQQLQKKVEYCADVLGDMALDLQPGLFTMALEQIRFHLNCAQAGFECVEANWNSYCISAKKEADEDE